jgi:hypothetical protein
VGFLDAGLRSLAFVVALGAGCALDVRLLSPLHFRALPERVRKLLGGAVGLALLAPVASLVLPSSSATPPTLLWVGALIALACGWSWGQDMTQVGRKAITASMALALLVLALELRAFGAQEWLLPVGLGCTCLMALIASAILMVAIVRVHFEAGEVFVLSVVWALTAPAALVSLVAYLSPHSALHALLISLYAALAAVLYVSSLCFARRTLDSAITLWLHRLAIALAATVCVVGFMSVVAFRFRGWDVATWSLVGCGTVLVAIEGLLQLWRTARRSADLDGRTREQKPLNPRGDAGGKVGESKMGESGGRTP